MVMKRIPILVAVGSLGAIAAAASCDSVIGLNEPSVSGVDASATGEGGIPEAGGRDADGSPESGTDAGATLTVSVAPAIENTFPFLVGPPLQGAQVAFDAPGGKRIEQFTGADGTTTFSGIDWSLGPAAVTAYYPGYALWTVEQMAPTASVSLVLYRQAPPSDITISGPITGKVSPSDYVIISTTLPETVVATSSYYQGQADSYSLSLQAYEGTPFTIVAADYAAGDASVSAQGWNLAFLQWHRYDEPAVTANTAIPIDFEAGAPLTQLQASGTIVPPHDEAGAFAAANPLVEVTTAESRGQVYLGLPSLLDFSADGGSFFYTESYVTLPGSHPLTYYQLYAADGQAIEVYVAGYPQQGAMVEGLPLPQQLGPASAFDAGMSLGPAPAGATETRLYLYQDPYLSAADTLWEVEVPTTATHVYFPPLPSAAAEAGAIPTGGTLVAYMRACVGGLVDAGGGSFCAQDTDGNHVVVPSP